MSAGLMSCVRENSPPIENEDGMQQTTTATTTAASTPENETHKRKRFHPLRNLRRIFRRRTVSHAEPPPQHIHNFGTSSSSTTDTTVSSKSGLSMPVSGGYLYLKRDHSSEGYNRRIGGGGAGNGHGGHIEDESSDMDRGDIADYQRSFSEGRLIDSDKGRDHLSQSHDSVFSESATASSLSSVLKAELTDVLRKRGLRPEASEEDLGLPQSPVTPQRKEKITHRSQGSLSILSITSSDMDEEQHSSMRQSATFDSSTSSSFFSKTDASHGSDEVDLDLSSSSRLSHSAARHKLAVRPKKKGPTRPRRSREPTNILPSTPEVNEDVNVKVTSSATDITDTPTKKIKSQSLPRESDPKVMQMFAKHSLATTNVVTAEITNTPQKTTIYVNKNISKSHDFEKATTTTITVGGSSVTQINKKPEDNGLINRFWNRSNQSKKKSEPEEDHCADTMEHKSILQVNTDSADITVKRPKSGAAARQRMVPKDIETEDRPKEETKPIPMARTSVGKYTTDASPPKTNWNEVSRAPKIILSPLQQKCKDMIEEESFQKKGVPKSKSFRTYEPSNLMNSNLPSLPNLTQAGDDSDSIPFSSLTENYKPKEEKIKFEINDYNLVKRSEESTGVIKKKNLVLKGAEELQTPASSANISQIEENIDKLMKSGVTTCLKSANSIDRDDTPTTSPDESTPASPKHDCEEVIFREKRVSTVLEQFEAKTAKVEKKPEAKPPKPPAALRISTRTSDKQDSPASPTKQLENKEETIRLDEDDRKVILQRRTSVSEERLKFERRISAGDECKIERKRSQSDDGLDIKPRASPENDEVQMRKKSIADEETGKDNTPELMKVFARRSMKLHVDDEEKLHEELSKMRKTAGNVDSDKENQSSSEEKLDKVAIVANIVNNNPTKSTAPIIIKDKDDNVIETEKKPSLVTPKPFGTPNRFSNVVNYRNTQSFIEVRKNLQAKNNNNTAETKPTQVTTNQRGNNNNNNQNNNNNNNTHRHTIANTIPPSNAKELETEFKGIRQRKAEWEKRANEGSK